MLGPPPACGVSNIEAFSGPVSSYRVNLWVGDRLMGEPGGREARERQVEPRRGGAGEGRDLRGGAEEEHVGVDKED